MARSAELLSAADVERILLGIGGSKDYLQLVFPPVSPARPAIGCGMEVQRAE